MKTAQESRDFITNLNKSFYDSIMKRIDNASEKAIMNGEKTFRVYCEIKSEDIIKMILNTLKELGYGAKHIKSSGWPTEESEHFKISL